MAAVSLIVMEHGSEWPGHVGNTGDVVAMSCGSEELVQRTRQGLAALRRRGQQVRIAVLACSDVMDASARTRRVEVLAELLAAVNAARFGRVVLSTDERASANLRSELLSLAEALRPRLQGTSATVSVRFGPPAEESARLSHGSVRKCLVTPPGHDLRAVRYPQRAAKR
jgi:hypothetical protein